MHALFGGGVDPACEQRRELVAATAAYTPRHLAEAAAGQQVLMVHHKDLLALP